EHRAAAEGKDHQRAELARELERHGTQALGLPLRHEIAIEGFQDEAEAGKAGDQAEDVPGTLRLPLLRELALHALERGRQSRQRRRERGEMLPQRVDARVEVS